jgi:Na+/melibiose symporter-like transporter
MIFQWVDGPTFDIALISYFCVVLGLPTSIFFMWKINEVRLSHECEVRQERLKKMIIAPGKNNSDNIEKVADNEQLIDEQERPRRLTDWLKMPSFYIFGVCFVAVKLYSNLFGAFILFYLRFVILLGVEANTDSNSINFAQALIPLTVCLSSVCCNLSLSWFYGKFGRKIALMLGGIICAGASAGMYFLTKEVTWPIYPISVLIGKCPGNFRNRPTHGALHRPEPHIRSGWYQRQGGRYCVQYLWLRG